MQASPALGDLISSFSINPVQLIKIKGISLRSIVAVADYPDCPGPMIATAGEQVSALSIFFFHFFDVTMHINNFFLLYASILQCLM